MKNISRILIVLFIVININSSQFIYANTKDKEKNILIVNSYDSENNWEKNIKKGFKDEFKDTDKINIKMEYLDIRSNSDKSYLSNYEKLLEVKYNNYEFDLIVAVDDEAFDLVKRNIFNKESIFYKKNIIFAGVNKKISLTKEEKQYMTGFVDERHKIELLKLITILHPNVKYINVLLDNTSYNKEIEYNLVENAYLIDKNIKINFIKGEYTEEILKQLKKYSNNNEAIMICGVFRDKNNKSYTSAEELINNISKIKDVPIYSSREDYLVKGVAGGYIDRGYEYGKVLAKMGIEIIENKKIDDIPLIEKLRGNYVVDYKSIYKYNINLKDLPPGIIVINKKPYDLLISKYQKRILLLFSILILSIIIYIIYMMYKHKTNSIKNKKMYKMAKEREELKTDFIANMSHELRTPINIITSASALLEINAKKSEEIDKEYLLEKLERINQNSNRLVRLINNLIDITKFDSGFYECNLKSENIVYVVEDIVLESIDYAKNKNIEVIFDTNEEEIITNIDKEKIERVILNLLSNAIKFTPENGKIEINVEKDGEYVYIRIKDNGIGIPKEKINQIFHRFYQVDSILNRRSEGSGIGLCIVDEIIKMHSGKINIESSEGVGTTFEIVLSIQDDNENKKENNTNISNLKDVVKIEMANI